MSQWADFARAFEAEMKRPDLPVTWKLAQGDYAMVNDVLVRRRQIKPLHVHQRLLLETILLLAPRTVLEFGCGAGDNLWNLQVLAPKIKSYGLDIAPEQIDFLKRRSPDLKSKVVALPAEDKALTAGTPLPAVDLTFCNISLMHIQDRALYQAALRNVFIKAKKWVVLMENWSTWPFLIDIQGLIALGETPWEAAHTYSRWSPEYARPHILVAAREPIVLNGFAALSDYNTLLAPVKADAYNIQAEKSKSLGEPVQLED